MINRIILLFFITLFSSFSRTGFALKLLGIDFDKDIYRKMNVNVGYEMQKYTGGITKVFEAAENSSIEYKANKAGHAMNFGIGYNFYLNLTGLLGSNFLTNLIQPFVGLEATVRAPVSGNKVLHARYDKNFDEMDMFGAGTAFGSYAYTSMPSGTYSGRIKPNADGSWTVTYLDRNGNEIPGGSEIRSDFAPGTSDGSIERQPDGTWTAHLWNEVAGRQFDYTNYVGHWTADPDSGEDTANNTYTVSLKAYEYLVLTAKFGCRLFLTNNISLSPYWMIGLNVAQAKVDVALLNRSISTTSTTSGFVTGIGVEAIVMDRYSLALEYRHSLNKFDLSSKSNKLEIASDNMNIKFGYYFW